MVRPFKVQVDKAILADLKARLARTRFPDQIEGAGWDYGSNLAYMKELVAYWRNEFDWRAQEERLNSFDHFTTEIDGLELHFIHQRSRFTGALPLVITHGWPGSVYEFVKVIGPLTDPVAYGGRAEDAFHVVCPSLPGFGFSGKPTDRGYSYQRIAGVLSKLMARLGYARYGAQGGDWGAAISTWMGQNDSDHCIGIHLNLVNAGPPKNIEDPFRSLTAEEKRRLEENETYRQEEMGYFQIQSTKPQTLGYGLHDSPAGLAAWITEKFHSWADTKGEIESRFSKDELLANIMIYWVTGTITSSTRIYYETRHARPSAQSSRVEVPVGCAIFPKELVYAPRQWVERRYNVKRWTEMPSGGHFAALEEPQLLVDDIRAFFRELR